MNDKKTNHFPFSPKGPKEDYSKGVKIQKTSSTEMTTKQKALAKSAKGSKSIASFFGKNPKKWNEHMILFLKDQTLHESNYLFMTNFKHLLLTRISLPNKTAREPKIQSRHDNYSLLDTK